MVIKRGIFVLRNRRLKRALIPEASDGEYVRPAGSISFDATVLELKSKNTLFHALCSLFTLSSLIHFPDKLL